MDKRTWSGRKSTILLLRITGMMIYLALLMSLFIIMPSIPDAAVLDDSVNEKAQIPKKIDLQSFSSVRDGALVIHVPKGIYIVNESIRLPSNSILEGEGDATILIFTAPFKGTRLITNADFEQGNSNITLRSFKVITDIPEIKKSDTPGIIRFENVTDLTITGLTMDLTTNLYGIDLSSCIRKAAVQRCTIINKGRGGCIMVRNRNPSVRHSSGNISVTHNNLESYIDEPLAVFGWLGEVMNATIQSNFVRSGTASFGISVYGIDSMKHGGVIRDVKILSNTIIGSRIGGIGIKGGARSVEVTGNSINNTRGDGLFLHPGGEGLPVVQGIRINQNTIVNAGRHCIFAAGKDIFVEQNKINGCAQSGVYAAGTLSVVDNVITDAKPGILIDGNDSVTIRNNSLHNAGNILFLQKSGGLLE